MNDPTGTLGRFAGLRVIHRAPMVELLTGFDKTGRPVTVVALTEEAGNDPSWCAALADAVAQDSTAIGPMESSIHEADLYATRPWAASYPEPGRRGAERLLHRLPGALADGADPTELLPRTTVMDVLRAQQSAGQRTSGPIPLPGHSAAPAHPGAPPPPANSPPPHPPAGLRLSHPPAGAPRHLGQPSPTAQALSFGPPTHTLRPGAFPPPQPVSRPVSRLVSRPATNPRTPLVIGLITAVTALLFVVGGGVGYTLLSNPDETVSATAAPPPTRTAAATPTPGSAPSASPSRSPLPATKPVLRSGKSVSVVGPTFQPGDATYTFAFNGWPFAFRGPSSWGCISATVPGAPDAYAWTCLDEKNPNAGQRANIMLRPCPTTCGDAEQKAMNKLWFDNEPQRARWKDPTTSYIEDPENARGNYSVDMSHFFGATPGGPLRWQVGVFVESPPATKGAVQKVLNDVRSQTP